MSCVWDSLLKGIREVAKKDGSVRPPKNINDLRDVLQATPEPIGVMWNGEEITRKQIEEVVDAMRCVPIHHDGGEGYLVSCCDPLFISASFIYKINIIHTMNKHYTSNYSVPDASHTITFKSSTGHMTLSSVS